MRGHRLRFRQVDTGTLYDCECGDFIDGAGTDDEAQRVYEEHDLHVRVALDSEGVEP